MDIAKDWYDFGQQLISTFTDIAEWFGRTPIDIMKDSTLPTWIQNGLQKVIEAGGFSEVSIGTLIIGGTLAFFLTYKLIKFFTDIVL